MDLYLFKYLVNLAGVQCHVAWQDAQIWIKCPQNSSPIIHLSCARSNLTIAPFHETPHSTSRACCSLSLLNLQIPSFFPNSSARGSRIVLGRCGFFPFFSPLSVSNLQNPIRALSRRLFLFFVFNPWPLQVGSPVSCLSRIWFFLRWWQSDSTRICRLWWCMAVILCFMFIFTFLHLFIWKNSRGASYRW